MTFIETIKKGWADLWDERRVEERSLGAVMVLLVGGSLLLIGGVLTRSGGAITVGLAALTLALGLLYVAGRGGL